MLSSGANVIIWDKMLLFGANVVMLSFGTNVIIWCYHVMLSSGMITSPFFIFPENFTHSSSTLIHLPPRFHCVGGRWKRTQGCCDVDFEWYTLKGKAKGTSVQIDAVIGQFF